MLNFVQNFADMLPDYEIACEHEHSNCVLVAHKKVYTIASLCMFMYRRLERAETSRKLLYVPSMQFKIDGRWHTWIDFDRFIELVSYSVS